MQKNSVNAITVVTFALILLTLLSAGALSRSNQVNADRTTSLPCQAADCHVLSPARWL